MDDKGVEVTENSIHKGDWSIQWIPGELWQPDTAIRVLDHMTKLGRNADAAKVFQGTRDGHPVVYVVTRWG